MPSYKPIMKFQYSRRLKYGKKGRVNYFRYKGRKVKAFITPDGRKLQILKIPKTLLPEFSDVEKVIPYESRLKVVKKVKPTPTPAPTPPQPQEKKEERPKPKPKPKPQPNQQPQPKPQPQPRLEEKLGEPRELTEAERRKAILDHADEPLGGQLPSIRI